jgi:hypothetical protein
MAKPKHYLAKTNVLATMATLPEDRLLGSLGST